MQHINSTIIQFNLQAEAFASQYGKLATGGSDAHITESVGRGLQFPEGVSIKCNNDLIAAIKGNVDTITVEAQLISTLRIRADLFEWLTQLLGI